jgi:hypothetical protein
MSVTTAITVAARVFAPGYLGELTRIVPFELADAVLEEKGGLEKRVRLAPSRAALYFLLAARAGAGPALGEGAAGPAPPYRYSAGEAAGRNPGTLSWSVWGS